MGYVYVGCGVGLVHVVPSLPSQYNILPMCDMTLCIVILWVDHTIWWTISNISSLLGWLCWYVKCLMWLLMRCIVLRLNMSMNAPC